MNMLATFLQEWDPAVVQRTSLGSKSRLAQAWEARGGVWPQGLVGGEVGMRVQGMLGFWSA